MTLAGHRILVTGGSGFIGRQVVRSLSQSGAEIRVVDLVAHSDPAVDTVVGDIADAQVIARAFAGGGFTGVVHLAAVTSVLKSIEQPELTYQTNVAGTHRLLEGARMAGVSALVFASTGGAIVGPMEEATITERAVLRPLTPYGATKAAAEMLMSAYTSVYDVRCTYLRFANVYGPGMQAKDSIIARLMRAIRLGTTFEIYGEGTQTRDYVNVLDVIEAVKLALTDERWSGPVLLASGESRSVLDVVEEVKRVSGQEFEVVHGPAKKGEVDAVVIDNARARSLGWEPHWSFHDGIAGVWEEWRDAELASA
ncbi:MAG TPA: NAD-dependent epimerase/dehydratase family protein [Solirubrobacteraceae bacterium]|nr:NAD-dependent epimerase/dehydratase family protein [Solirubrobacteraceae bacterium]